MTSFEQQDITKLYRAMNDIAEVMDRHNTLDAYLEYVPEHIVDAINYIAEDTDFRRGQR